MILEWETEVYNYTSRPVEEMPEISNGNHAVQYLKYLPHI